MQMYIPHLTPWNLATSVWLDLYFEGNNRDAAGVASPDAPGSWRLRTSKHAHWVSEARLLQENAAMWRNTMKKWGPMTLQLAGRFITQLNFGRQLPFRYWVYSCTNWLQVAPGALLNCWSIVFSGLSLTNCLIERFMHFHIVKFFYQRFAIFHQSSGIMKRCQDALSRMLEILIQKLWSRNVHVKSPDGMRHSQSNKP